MAEEERSVPVSLPENLSWRDHLQELDGGVAHQNGFAGRGGGFSSHSFPYYPAYPPTHDYLRKPFQSTDFNGDSVRVALLGNGVGQYQNEVAKHVNRDGNQVNGAGYNWNGVSNHVKKDDNHMNGFGNHLNGVNNHVNGDNNHIDGVSNNVNGDSSHANGNLVYNGNMISQECEQSRNNHSIQNGIINLQSTNTQQSLFAHPQPNYQMQQQKGNPESINFI